MRIPTFVLRRLYVSGSLQATREGLRFVLRNHMATATLTELRALAVNGHRIALERVRLRVGDREVDVASVTPVAPLLFGRGDDAEVQVRGVGASGAVRVRLEATSAEFGELVIEFDDRLQGPEA